MAAIASSPTLSGAVCVDPGAREVFDAAAERISDVDVLEDALFACARCPARQDCREWVQGLPASQRPLGVVGGLVIVEGKRGPGRPRRSAA